MKTMTVREIKESVGTEFKYALSNGLELPAVIAAFDENIGFTVLATDFTDSGGIDHSSNVDKNGNLCLIGVGRDSYGLEIDFFQKITAIMMVVKHLGYYIYGAERKFGSAHGCGLAACSF